MARKPADPAPKAKSRSKTSEGSTRPVEVVGQTIERALDPLASALKRAALKRADKTSRAFDAPAAPAAAAAPAKGALPVSPLAVPFPKMPPIAGPRNCAKPNFPWRA